jgi:N-acetylmuramic acid 6-phosphate etherase
VSENSKKRSEEFLKISGQFKLGALVTEASHPVTANLSDVAKSDITAALKLLFDVDDDVVKKFREFAQSGKAIEIKEAILRALKNGGRIFFTGCGSTGRLSILLDSVWRGFWQILKETNWRQRTFSVMAGGDYALIKSVEGFEDFAAFGKKQMADLGVSAKDIVFAITEGGETSFVIGTAWAGVEAGAKVYFIYNNPDDLLCKTVERSREIIEDSRVEKINLTTGPMAISGSTRMQATSIQLCVMLTVLEMVVRDLIGLELIDVPKIFMEKLSETHAALKSPEVLAQLAQLVALEESVYRAGHKNNYFADRLGIDVLTDTTERSPTFCTPPFRKFDETSAAESWAFLFLPDNWTDSAWENLLKRKPRCVEWSEEEIRALFAAGPPENAGVTEEKISRTLETVGKIGVLELMRFRIGINGARFRPQGPDDSAIAIFSSSDRDSSVEIFAKQLETARRKGSKTGLIFFGIDASNRVDQLADLALFVPVPKADFLLNGVLRVAAKLVMNALSTCTMVRLGRVMGNTMIRVVPSNLKLIDRATRYISRLAGLPYEHANELLFEVIEYVEPRMKSDQAYPAVVEMAVLRAREKLTNEAAEKRLAAESF